MDHIGRIRRECTCLDSQQRKTELPPHQSRAIGARLMGLMMPEVSPVTDITTENRVCTSLLCSPHSSTLSVVVHHEKEHTF